MGLKSFQQEYLPTDYRLQKFDYSSPFETVLKFLKKRNKDRRIKIFIINLHVAIVLKYFKGKDYDFHIKVT